ncbi:MAG: methyl-accepting chemotaxis protein [Lachnospiraceae bacterium]
MDENKFNEDTEFDFDKAFELDDEPKDGFLEEDTEDESVGGSYEDEAASMDTDDEWYDLPEEHNVSEEQLDFEGDDVTEEEAAAKENEEDFQATVEKLFDEKKEKVETMAAELGDAVREQTEKAKEQLDEGVKILKAQRRDRKKIGFFSGIRFKITAAFIVPVILMIVLGVVSYTRSSSALTSSYEKNALATIDTTADYFDLVLETIRSLSYDIAVSSIAREYYGKAYSDNEYNEIMAYNSLKSEVAFRKVSSRFIKNIVFTANYGDGISTAVDDIPENVYEQFKELDVAKVVDKKDLAWLGYHEDIDALMNTSGYAFSIVRKAYNTHYRQVGYIVVDVDYDQVANIISTVAMGDNAIVALITPDGREISYRSIPGSEPETDEEGNTVEAEVTNDSLDITYIMGTEIYDAITASEESSGSEYVDFEGEQYLLLYNKLDVEGFMVVALVPKDYIIADANQIAVITIVAVIVTALIVIFIGLILSTSIGTTIRKIMNGLEKASTGDLTVDIRTRRKDEFMILCDSTNQMLANIRGLINKADTVSEAVGKASESVAGNSGILLEETKAITTSISEVEQGIVMQAQDAENCLKRMDDLSKKIEGVTDNTNRIAEIADNTKDIVSDGLETISVLKDKAKATSEVTAEVISNIQELDEASGSIAKIIGAINDIADQTSLLSLNASIEAARAGDAGRGFAVVADSIRKLAEQSLNSVNEIKEIVDRIQKQTVDTVNVAKQAEVIVASQEEALKNTVEVFQDIDNHVSGLADNLVKISDGINDMDSAKKDTLMAIESISAVAQQTASSATEVNEAASRQLEAVEKLNNESEELIHHSEDLVEAINKFII